jgi:hypothetical protein
MKKSELLKALRDEILCHDLDTFISREQKIVQTGCSTCQKHFGTVEQFKFHLCNYVRPPFNTSSNVKYSRLNDGIPVWGTPDEGAMSQIKTRAKTESRSTSGGLPWQAKYFRCTWDICSVL